MSSKKSAIPAGYSDIPAGHIASVVTCLEMRQKPDIAPRALPEGFTLERYTGDSLDQYRALFRKVGANWLWFARLLMSDEKLTAVLSKDSLEIYVIRHESNDVGLMELDFGVPGEAELAYLGLVVEATGQGIGRAIMNAAIELAWSKPISRFWVHTCSFDHPSALSFYCRSGFVPYALQVEVQPDPRLSGALPLTAAPQVPIIRS